MARPRTITDEQIIEATRDLLLSEGLNVSSAKIARAAGVSEGTIFKRFQNKELLIERALGFDTDAFVIEMPDGTLRERLEHIGTRFIEHFLKLFPHLMVATSHAACTPDQFIRRHPNPPPLRFVRLLTQVFDAEIKAGRLRPADPEVIARMFLGSVHSYCFFEFTGINERMPLAVPTFVRGVVDVLLRGIELPIEAEDNE